MKKQSVLILGGGGFIGSHLAEYLMRDFKVIIFEKEGFSRKNIQEFENDIEIIEGDFQNPIDYTMILNDIDFIFHLAWSTIHESSNKNCQYDIASNVFPTLALLDSIKSKKGIKIIFVSSGGTVYGNSNGLTMKENSRHNPICSYGISKLMVEKYLYLYAHLYKINYAIGRLPNVYGERQHWNRNQGIITTFIYNMLINKPLVVWGDGSTIRDYIYVHDAVHGVARLLHYKGEHKIFNISTGMGYSVNDIIAKIINVVDSNPKIMYNDSWIPAFKIFFPAFIIDSAFVPFFIILNIVFEPLSNPIYTIFSPAWANVFNSSSDFLKISNALA